MNRFSDGFSKFSAGDPFLFRDVVSLTGFNVADVVVSLMGLTEDDVFNVTDDVLSLGRSTLSTSPSLLWTNGDRVVVVFANSNSLLMCWSQFVFELSILAMIIQSSSSSSSSSSRMDEGTFSGAAQLRSGFGSESGSILIKFAKSIGMLSFGTIGAKKLSLRLVASSSLTKTCSKPISVPDSSTIDTFCPFSVTGIDGGDVNKVDAVGHENDARIGNGDDNEAGGWVDDDRAGGGVEDDSGGVGGPTDDAIFLTRLSA